MVQVTVQSGLLVATNKGPEFWKLGAIFGYYLPCNLYRGGIPWIQFVMPLLG